MNICLVGEAWGQEEEKLHQPFVGPAGRFLNIVLSQSGIRRSDCFVTNVFNLRPQPTNDVKNLCGTKTKGIPWMPYLRKSKYVLAKYASELERLYEELRREKPNLIVALGATASWAILRTSGIKRIRGTTTSSQFGKVLPTLHPSDVLRDWPSRTMFLADMRKAAREAQFPEIRRPHREVWIEPTIQDMVEFAHRYIVPSPDLAIDIETKGRQITCIGFAPDPYHALVVPFYDKQQEDGNYWRTHREEVQAWCWVRNICSLRKRIVGQNFLYDMNHLWTNYGIPVLHAAEDTMLLSHARHPEMEKGLGFLGTIHTDECSWKINRDKDTLKKED